MAKAREFQENIYFCFIDAKAFDCVDHNKLWKVLKEMEYHHYLSAEKPVCSSRTTVRTGHGTNNRLVQNWERSTSRLYIVTLFI